MVEWWHRQRQAVFCWSLAVGFAVALKWHFSVAATSELGWMLQPLVLLLRTLTGWHFERNAGGEWRSFDADIVIVKACAGINFMVLSFLGWCWVWLRQSVDRHPVRDWVPRFAAAVVCAWLTTLLVNTLRIVAVVRWQPALEQWMAAAEAHRLLGLLVYLPALTLQWTLGDRHHWRRALLACCGGYAALMLGVPLITGNASRNWGTYSSHALLVSGLLLLPCVIALPGIWRTIALPNRRTGVTPRDGRTTKT